MMPSSEPIKPPLFTVPLYQGIPSRGITPSTCELYHTYLGSHPLEVFHQYFDLDTGVLCGIKVRRGGWTHGKKETHWQSGSKRSLFGCHLYSGERLPVYLFEGETDAMAMSQTTTGLCLAYGGKPSPSILTTWMAWIEGVATEVHLCFDSDEEGEAYTQQFMDGWKGQDLKRLILPPETKDLAQLLLEGGTPTFSPLHYTLPDCVLTGQDLASPKSGGGKAYLTTGHRDLDFYIGGYSEGDIITLAGPTKHGKSAFVTDLTVRFLRTHPGKVLFIPLELSVDDTMDRLAASSLGTTVVDADPTALSAERGKLADRILMVRHFGHFPIDDLDLVLKCIPKGGVKLVVLDHITGAATSFHEGLTTALVDAMMSLIQARLNEYRVPGIVVTHTNASGGDILHPGAIRGSQAIGQLSSSLLGIRRLESGLSEVYTIAPVRGTGRMGRVTFEFDGTFKPLNRKTSDL